MCRQRSSIYASITNASDISNVVNTTFYTTHYACCRLESLREYEGQPKMMKDVDYVDEGKDDLDDGKVFVIFGENGVERSGGLIERMR